LKKIKSNEKIIKNINKKNIQGQKQKQKIQFKKKKQ
jgi:hypothetical protein